MSAFKPLVFSGVQPTGNLHLGNYLGAIKKFSDPTKRVMPITAEMIYLIASLPLQGWDDEVFQLACLLGFFFLLRVGEFAEHTVPAPGRRSPLPLLCRIRLSFPAQRRTASARLSE